MRDDKSQLRIKTCVLGMVATNCYILYHEATREAAIIDPADDAERIEALCGSLELKPTAILLTHGHFDHIMAVEELARRYGIEVYAGEQEAGLLADPGQNLSAAYGRQAAIRAQHLLADGEEVRLAGFTFRVLHTPGHTAGSVCYWMEDEGVLFSGDTLFCESLGRTDFPGGSTRDIIQSIVMRLFPLPDDTMVYSGHGEPTTIGHEKAYNPVARYA